MGKRWAVKPTAEKILDQAAADTQDLKAQGTHPHLAVVLVGENPASQVYVRNKIKTCETLGIKSSFIQLPAETDTAQLLKQVNNLNDDPQVHGILVQLPLPPQISEKEIITAIHPDKDVDGFHPVNVGRLSQGEPGLFPCTPLGVINHLKASDIQLKGMHAVVVGRSNIVGKPMAQMLLAQNCTVTIMHSRTADPQKLCRQADLVVAAVGVTGLVTGEWLKPGALVVDVGMNTITDRETAERFLNKTSKKWAAFEKKGRVLYGDVHYDSALEVAELVTPVPGGVGKLTIAQLMANCVTAARSLK